MQEKERQKIENTCSRSVKQREEKFQELEAIRKEIIKANHSENLHMSTIRTTKTFKEAVVPLTDIGTSLSDVNTIEDDQVSSKVSKLSLNAHNVKDSISTESSISPKQDDSASSTDNLSSSSEDGSHDLMVTTPSSVQSDDGPLGVSITTWKLQKFNRKMTAVVSSDRRSKILSLRKIQTKPPIPEDEILDRSNNNEYGSIVPQKSSHPHHKSTDHTNTHNHNHLDEYVREIEDHTSCKYNALEDNQLTFGDGIEVQMQISRNKSVRFMGVTQSAEEKLRQARELLASVTDIKEKSVRVYDRKPRYIPK